MPLATRFLRGPLRPQKFRRPGPPLPSPTFVPSYFIIGITRDETGAIQGNAFCKLYRTSDDAVLATTFSDAGTGQYFFALDNVTQSYVVSQWGNAGQALYGSAVYGGASIVGVTDNSLVAV